MSKQVIVDQELIQRTVQKHVLEFIKILPKYVEEWKMILQECTVPVQSLLNRAGQLRSVEK